MAQETTTSPGTYLHCSPAFDFVLVGPVNEIVVSNKERMEKKNLPMAQETSVASLEPFCFYVLGTCNK
jgi:hypothetical protein